LLADAAGYFGAAFGHSGVEGGGVFFLLLFAGGSGDFHFDPGVFGDGALGVQDGLRHVGEDAGFLAGEASASSVARASWEESCGSPPEGVASRMWRLQKEEESKAE
jgi:hypothetical protein